MPLERFGAVLAEPLYTIQPDLAITYGVNATMTTRNTATRIGSYCSR
jgi:hypothetical protein